MMRKNLSGIDGSYEIDSTWGILAIRFTDLRLPTTLFVRGKANGLSFAEVFYGGEFHSLTFPRRCSITSMIRRTRNWYERDWRKRELD